MPKTKRVTRESGNQIVDEPALNKLQPTMVKSPSDTTIYAPAFVGNTTLTIINGNLVAHESPDLAMLLSLDTPQLHTQVFDKQTHSKD